MTLKVGVIGYGYWGPNLVRNFTAADGCEVVSVCDRSVDRLQAASKLYPAIRTLQDPNEAFSDSDINAIAIATPVNSHFELGMAALQAGKHVLIEKPMTETAAQSRQLIQEAEKRGLTLMVDHTFLYTGAVRKIKEIIDAGDLGDIQYFDSTRINLGLFQHDVDVIWDLAVHDLSILDFVMGEYPVTVSAVGTSHVNGMPENIAYLTLFFPSGAIAHVNVNWLAPVKLRHTLIGGSKKMIVYDDLQPSEKIKVYDKGIDITDDAEQIYNMIIGYRTGDMWAPQLDPSEALLTEVSHFIDCINTSSTPITDGRIGLRVVEILEAASKSMKNQGKPVDITSNGAL